MLIRSEQPLVRQLLMGEGKSAVIAPLLSLLLAEELVLQAMGETAVDQMPSYAFWEPIFPVSDGGNLVGEGC